MGPLIKSWKKSSQPTSGMLRLFPFRLPRFGSNSSLLVGKYKFPGVLGFAFARVLKSQWSFTNELLLFWLVCTATSSSFVAHASPIKLRISVTSLESSTKTKACLKFKEVLEARSKGDFQVELHPGGKLYRDREEIDAVQLGALEMIVPSFAKFDTIGVSEFSVFAIPYLFKDFQDVHTIADGHVGQQLLKLLEPKGMKGLAFWDLGFNQFHANRPLHVPSDMKGLKFKLIRGKVYAAVAKALETVPVMSPKGTVLEGFLSKQVEASTTPILNFYYDGYVKVQKHLTLSSANFHGYVVVLSLKFWNSLTSQGQEQVEQSLREVTHWERQQAERDHLESLEKLRKEGITEIYVPTEAEAKKWKEALLPVQKQFKREKEGAYIERIQEALGTR